MIVQEIGFLVRLGVADYKLQITADDGKKLTNDNGATLHDEVVVDSADGWEEVVNDEATESDYITALQDLGVEVN